MKALWQFMTHSENKVTFTSRHWQLSKRCVCVCVCVRKWKKELSSTHKNVTCQRWMSIYIWFGVRRLMSPSKSHQMLTLCVCVIKKKCLEEGTRLYTLSHHVCPCVTFTCCQVPVVEEDDEGKEAFCNGCLFFMSRWQDHSSRWLPPTLVNTSGHGCKSASYWPSEQFTRAQFSSHVIMSERNVKLSQR